MFVLLCVVNLVSKELSATEKKHLELVDGVTLPPTRRKRRRGHRAGTCT